MYTYTACKDSAADYRKPTQRLAAMHLLTLSLAIWCIQEVAITPSLVYSYRSYPSDPPARLMAGLPITIHSTRSVEDPSLLILILSHLGDNICPGIMLISCIECVMRLAYDTHTMMRANKLESTSVLVLYNVIFSDVS